MTVTHVWVGAVTPISARVRGKIVGTSARLAVDTDALFPDPTFFGPETPTADDMVSFTATGLDPDTRYHYALEVDGALETAAAGQFRTHPPVGSQANFTFAATSCAGATSANQVSNRASFDTLRRRGISENWLFLLHMGDMHYRNIGASGGPEPVADLAAYRRAYDDVLTFDGAEGLDALQGRLYRNVPLVYQWDDHDYGPNNSDGTHVGKDEAAQVYRERVPHYPLAAGDGPIYHSFQVGRVLFVIDDHRFDRDPNSDPASASKTMLGETQKTWMRDLLATSDAAFLVWATDDYVPLGDVDSWRGFTNEQAEMRQMLEDLGWLGRMCILSGDIHQLAIDTGGGTTNPWGVPVFIFSSMDSGSQDALENFFDTGPSSPGRDRYGTIRVEDFGTEIRVTGVGWIDDTVWRSHTFTTSGGGEPSEPGEPSPGVPPVSEAAIRTRVTWLGCDLVTGRIIAELPDIAGPVSRVLGSRTSSGLRMPIPLAGPAALGPRAFQATQPGRTMIVPVVNDIPAAGFIVLTRNGGTEATLDLGTVSIEGYLTRRYVRDHTWRQMDEASVIAAGLVGDAQVEGIGLIVDAPSTGTLRDRTYVDKDDATVARRLEELMAVENGPEWTIDLDWLDSSQTVVAKVFRVRKRIGRVAAQPTAVFETTAHSVFSSRGGSEARYTFSEDFSAGRGANHVVATSSGEGDDRPTSVPARAEDLLAAGWPRYEERITPSTSIKNVSVLDAHARAELALTKFGARTWKITSRWDATPRYGVDWRLGDDVAWRLVGHRHPEGVAGQGRAIGFELDMQAGTLQPILFEPEGVT